ncbi:hypothetical protein KPH14_001982 [Odynerus spinipes]|uniref:Uncharacterized protein n=1 Tax=Odynerus spinipes TaxID=1348599 RepID=A0AAD9S091_9HYME|nr:hypothetical protein KPH14_001982 [Odynerus spinipes]
MQLPRKMSAQNVMASISRTLGTREKAHANEIRFAGEERKDKLYEPKHKKKLVRVLTVVAYIIFVSMAAILLSLYYTFLWDPKDQAIRTMRMHKPDCASLKSFDSLTIPPISNETQIEKVTARSMTINDTLESSEMPTTLREKSLIEILTETTKSRQVSPDALSSTTPTKVGMIDVVTISKPYEESPSRN